jgi:LysM repeat protein
MQTARRFLSIIVIFSCLCSHAQDKSIIQDYIDTYKEMAIEEMQRTGVPASIKLAQGIHETMAGTSVLVRKSNNHFGIKCKATWKGPSVSHDDDARGECFRKYESSDQSYRDHSDFLKNGARYAFLFNLDPLDYEGWAKGLKKAGYATNPKYPQIIIKLIKDYNLQDYTLIALGNAPEKNEEYAKNNNQELVPEHAITRTEIQDEGIASNNGLVKYPSGEFKINDTRVVYGLKGTSFLAIADQYNVSLSKLFEYNELDEAEELGTDQLLFLQRKRKAAEQEFHLVKPGEDLYSIAQANGIRLESLLAYNQLSEDIKPLAGTKLYMRGNAPASPALALLNKNTKNDESVAMKYSHSSKPVLHTVKSKETIYSIAKRYNVTMEQIVDWNLLRGHTLHIGQELKIYK